MIDQSIKLACVGDLMCGDSFYALGSGCSASLDKYGEHFLPDNIKAIFTESDYVLANIECPISNVGRKNSSLRTLHMRGRPEYASHLKKWGINVANVANNHILEQGYEAACDTVKNLENAQLHVIGQGEVLFRQGIGSSVDQLRSVAFMGICLKEEKYAYAQNLGTLFGEIKKLKRQGIDSIIVSIHWGDEFIDGPNNEQRRIGHELIDNGVVLVAGHHPHVVQGIEAYRNGLIAYSLGNYIFDQFLPDNRWSVILQVMLTGNTIENYQYVPVVLDPEHRPCLPEGPDNLFLLDEMSRRVSLAQQPVYSDYDERVKIEMQRFRSELKKTIRRNIRKMPVKYWHQLLLRPVQRRLGIW